MIDLENNSELVAASGENDSRVVNHSRREQSL